jgi:hypothetical protein
MRENFHVSLGLEWELRCNCRAVQRYELSQRVVREYGQAHSYWLRLLYIDFCEHMLKYAPSHTLPQLLYEPWTHYSNPHLIR